MSEQIKKDHTVDGVICFEHEGVNIVNPFASSCGRFSESPAAYGFEIYGTGGNCDCWLKTLTPAGYDGACIVITEELNIPDNLDNPENIIIGLYKNLDDLSEGGPIVWTTLADVYEYEKRLYAPEDNHIENANKEVNK